MKPTRNEKLEFLLKEKTFEELSLSEKEFALDYLETENNRKLQSFYNELKLNYRDQEKSVELYANTKKRLIKQLNKEKKPLFTRSLFSFPKIHFITPLSASIASILILIYFFYPKKNTIKESEYLTEEIFNLYTPTIDLLMYQDNFIDNIKTMESSGLCYDIDLLSEDVGINENK